MKKRLALITAALILIVPAFAVFNEKNLSQTISVLRFELRQEYSSISRTKERFDAIDEEQHHSMVDMIKTCNELAVMLYSQNQDFTFDMTYALKSVTKEYKDFGKRRKPFDRTVERLDIEIERYSRLVESLRRIPPILDDIVDLPDSLKYRNDSLNFNIPSFAAHMHEHEHAHDHESDELSEMISESLMHLTGSQMLQDDLEIDDIGHVEHLHTFELDAQGQEDRDSCIFYASEMLKLFSEIREEIVKDNEHYENTSARLKESYDYAQARYKLVQAKIFKQGQDNFLKVLRRFPTYFRRAMLDARNKYTNSIYVGNDNAPAGSEWRGAKVIGFLGIVVVYLLLAAGLAVAGVQILKRKIAFMQTEEFQRLIPCLTFLCASVTFAIVLMVLINFVHHNYFVLASNYLLVFAWLLSAILLSLLIRLDGWQIKAGMKLYMPVVVMGLIVIGFRIIFIPNSVANIVFPPLMLGFCFWQFRECAKRGPITPDSDKLLGWISFGVILVSTVASWVGFVLLSVQFIIWWLFQVAAIETLTAIDVLLDRYYNKSLRRKFEARKGDQDIHTITWFFDLVKSCAIPVIAIVSIPFCLLMAADVFDLTDYFREFYHKSIIDLADKNGNEILHISFSKIVVAASLYFIFRYVGNILKAVYHDYRVSAEKRKSGRDHIYANQINFTLANNVISILNWGIYIITCIILLKIPTGAVSIVGAGLATGLGLAMKDILNNFIYGIQLMSGRLRVGDWVECDGIRGKVTSISYQSTQIETIEGALISFLNQSLFNQNFKNLTRNNSYEFVKIVVGVSYGSDIPQVRQVVLDAMAEIDGRDKYGRHIVDQSRGVTVAVDDFADSSVNIAIKQYVLVAERNSYIANAKEAIYGAFNDKGIEIPFPQRDVHIKVENQDNQ